MRQKGFILIPIVIILLVVTIAGVGFVLIRKNINNPSNNLPQTDEQPTLENSTPTTKANNLSEAHNIFGFNLLKELKKEEGNTNIFISPTSISLALSMVYNGAGGETKTAMAKTLLLQHIDINTLNEQSLDMINNLKNPDENITLSIANSVWARKGETFKPNFINTVQKFFNAKTTTLDFNDPKSADLINSWASENTNGKIPTIVNPPLPSDMVMYLINAVYFKGSWTKEFDKKLTSQRNFTLSDGAVEQRSLMKRSEKMLYYENSDFQSTSLPYGKNRRLAMLVFLPKDINKFIDSLNQQNWDKWTSSYENTQGTLLLPKFKITYEKDLVSLLSKLGMGIAFQDKADFSGIGDSLRISQVRHKTYVDNNEEGTEAAAVTSIGIGVTGVISEPKTFYMEVNRPFFFVIQDTQTKEILFTGIISNPKYE